MVSIDVLRLLVPARMHLALKAYQELLMTVNEMDRSQDESIRHSANVIKSIATDAKQYRCYNKHSAPTKMIMHLQR